jgi:hypothetical protein
MAATVEMAVSVTDSATLPFAFIDMKLEMLPPGHEATRIIPRAMLGAG